MDYDVCTGFTVKPFPYSIMQHIFGAKLPINSFRMELLEQTPGRTRVYTPGEEIKGKIFLSNSDNFGCLGILVSLEGCSTTNYRSGSSTRTRTENLLPYCNNEWATTFVVGSKEDIAGFDFFSPKFYIVKKAETENHCPFSIPIRKLNPFAGTFKGASGEISYRIVAYVVTMRITNLRAVQQNIIIQSYLNIQAMPNLFNPITIKGEQCNSFYSKKKIKYCLTLTAGGYLPGEIVQFYLNLNNPHRRNVSKLSIALVKKITFTSDFTSRCSKTIIAIRENKDVDFSANSSENFYWEDSFVIPIGSPATFEGHVIKLQYFIKVDVFTINKPDFPMMKGESPITIGSVREDESLSFENLPLSRSLSIMSLSSSTGSFASMPPAYEQILSRAPSMETLPPHYDDILPVGSENLTINFG